VRERSPRRAQKNKYRNKIYHQKKHMKRKHESAGKQVSRTNRRKELTEHIQKLLEERGLETLKRVQEAIFEDEIESKDICEALKHFLSYRHGFLVRPMLISLGCEAVGGKTDLVPDVATPLVLMSAGMDIHDDIIDNQEKQESRRTVYGRFGQNVALLAGDALLFKGLTKWHHLAEKLQPQAFVQLTQMLNEAFFEVGDGEALELAFAGRLDVKPERYLAMVCKKAADIDLLLRVGAFLGHGTREQVESLGKIGRSLGMLWVLSDDVNDIFDGEEMKRRLNGGCVPLPLLYASRNEETKTKLRNILKNRQIDKKDARMVAEFVMKTDGLAVTKKKMKDLASNMMREIEKLPVTEKLTLLAEASLDFISQV
jgi:geranylgeranyl diphosphate synthase type II